MLKIIVQDDNVGDFANPESVNDPTSRKASVLTGPFADLLPLLTPCRGGDPSELPEFDQLRKNVKLILRPYAKASSLTEKILRRLEAYTDELDSQVAQRTIDLEEERKRCDNLLWAMLPSGVVNDLRRGHTPDAEYYLSTSIMFVEVTGLGALMCQIEPEESMAFLNEVFCKFDGLLNNHDVYKVETIKESYLVASGVPRRNESRHVYEVCGLAVSMMTAYLKTFALRFDGTTTLRAGIHSGSVAAGVVGRKAPRYCLFGDTINTASRMMSTGEDGKIHISHNAADQLKNNSKFVIEPRGVIEVKVYFYFGDSLEFRKMMIKAWELNMTNGEHVFIILATLRPTNKPASGYLTWENHDRFDSIAKLAYRSVLIMEPDDSILYLLNDSAVQRWKLSKESSGLASGHLSTNRDVDSEGTLLFVTHRAENLPKKQEVRVYIKEQRMTCWYFVSEYCTRGSLPELLNKMALDADFQASLMLDALKAKYLLKRF
ncbi:guanylate cyclase 2D-like [Paramacrobiotus metropolitanus]|uniref:guanylate cyclase 2D-like n=1 Tax=Paramacrobiotus metropolitanus TaxID=2943436 RepID=UPI00244606C5|nr:guanylate cyclase 2D-like [Paramacrobiotus metropolitanus]